MKCLKSVFTNYLVGWVGENNYLQWNSIIYNVNSFRCFQVLSKYFSGKDVYSPPRKKLARSWWQQDMHYDTKVSTAAINDSWCQKSRHHSITDREKLITRRTRSAAVAEIADRTSRLFTYLCWTTNSTATEWPLSVIAMVSMLSRAIPGVEILEWVVWGDRAGVRSKSCIAV